MRKKPGAQCLGRGRKDSPQEAALVIALPKTILSIEKDSFSYK